MKIAGIMATGSLMLLWGCGDTQEPCRENGNGSQFPDTITITAEDTLGKEFGEGPDVFAFIADAAFTPDGNVAVLDAGKVSLQVFTPEGEELFTAGRRGSGPGEYTMPLGLAVVRGGFVASDLAGGKLLMFDSTGAFTDEITGFFPVPPVRIKGAGDRLLATDIFMDIREGSPPSVSMDFVAFEGGSEPAVVYESHPMQMSGGMVNSDEAPDFAFAAGPGGEAVLVLVSDSLFRLACYQRDGGPLLEISEERERIPLSEEELAEEELAISLTMENGETSLDRSRQPVSATHRNIAEEVGVDAGGLLWVRMGDSGSPYFRVYTPEGELLHIAVPDGTIDPDARYSISPEGMLAYDTDPMDWPKVYLLQVN